MDRNTEAGIQNIEAGLTAETQRRGEIKPEKSPLIPLLQRGRLYYSPLWQRGGRGDFRKGYKTTAFFILLLLISACGGGGSGSSSTGPSTTVAFSGSSSGYNVYMARNSSLSSGSVLAIDVKVDSVSNVFGAAFNIGFDSTKMTYSSYSAGSFLETGGNNVTYLASPSANKLIVGVSRQAPSGGQSGSGTLVTLKFNVIGGGSVSFSNNALKDLSNNTISATWSSGGAVTAP